jgi:low affinity Fe/Cu permease
MKNTFRKFSNWASAATGTVWAFILAITIILVWAVTGPVFKFADTWQLIINTGTTIITFLMVFLIQSTQNRDNAALHAKLDELIVHTKGAHDELAAAEHFSDDELEQLREHFRKVGERGGTGANDPLGIEGLPRNDHRKTATTAKSPTRRRKTAKR